MKASLLSLFDLAMGFRYRRCPYCDTWQRWPELHAYIDHAGDER